MSVPWQQIISLHKEIARRAEDSFFSLPLSQESFKRWASLSNFAPTQLAGPWSVNASAIDSKELMRGILADDEQELFWGGPCYLRKKKDNFYWQPILYRAVKIAEADEGNILILPDQGTWDVSPLLYDHLNY
ncbi:MAG: hypothetical protein VB051_06320 [Candidatus Pelethousia sp.]|nr:hypothetical protein [Candidatus Pelethousia sp.]